MKHGLNVRLTLSIGAMLFLAIITSVASQEMGKMRSHVLGSIGLRIFQTLAKSNAHSKENIVVSSEGIDTAFGILYLGSDGDTKATLERVLDIKGGVLPKPLAAISESSVSFQEYSSIWTRNGVPLLPAFIDAVSKYGDADLKPLPSYGAVDAVNHWVETATRGKIPQIVTSLKPNVSLMLVNAVYFRAVWSTPFDEHDTVPGLFSLPDGGSSTVAFMNRIGNFPYKSGDDFDWVRVSYGNGRFVMDMLLPKHNQPAINFLSFLLSIGDPHTQNGPRLATGRLQLPRFTVKSVLPLEQTLSSLGLESLFRLSSADFSRISLVRSMFALDEFRHTAVISVDEAGTEAAAVTSITMVGRLPAPAHSFEMRLDHPFLFAIRDSQDVNVLFVGLISDPAHK